MISTAQAPLQLSKYKLIEEIGHGGMATVYRAHDTRLDRQVALKLIHPHLRRSAEIEARFDSEARVVAKLRHPNIVEVFDVSNEDDEERYLIVELIRGPTLRQLLAEHRRVPVELGAMIVLELASALEHAHGIGVIHRDIKPENVLLEAPPAQGTLSEEEIQKARVKLTDFGIAKLLDAQGVTSTGQVLGSPAHMAPEQIEGRCVDRRADIFSLGVLFYETIVGLLPFAGKNPAQVLRNVLEGNFEAPDRVRPEIGSRWSVIVVKALARDPDERFNTIEDFSQAVRNELKAVDFNDTRADITRYLIDPEKYEQEFIERIVKGLSRSGRRSRAQRDRVAATAQFSRALAYKPGDATLLKQVSGLRRDDALRRLMKQAVAALLFGLLAVLIVFAWPEKTDPVVETPPPDEDEAVPARPTAVLAPASPTEAVEVVPSSAATGEERALDTTETKRPPKRPEPEPEVEFRTVSVKVTGVLGGSVKIDGEPKQWFGTTHQLSVGDHLFEFLPPNDNCCKEVRKTVTIRPGEGTQVVSALIPFKDATLKVVASEFEGMRLACPALFPGALSLPGERSVVMSEETWTGTCTLSGPADTSGKRQKRITLRAGDITVLTWP